MAVPYKLNYFEIESGLGTSSTFLHKGDFTANRIIKIGGTSNDILLGDGSVGSLSGKQNTITLTTIGTSGAATLIGATLNIPNYSPDLTGYVTLNTNQTITGTKTFDNNTLKLIGIGTTRPTIITNAGGLSKGSLIENFFGFNSNNDIYFSKSQNSQGIFSFNNTNLRTYTFQDLSGTVAFTSDIPSLAGYVPTSRELTINGTTYDLTANRSWSVGTVTSVGLTMPTAFSVANSPVTGAGTLAVTANGLASQYIRGDGQLADFPTGGGGGGSSVSYYLNGSVNQGTFVGNTYYEMNKVPVFGAGTDFSIGANGYIAQFITDANDPNSLLIPAGNWNFETYFSASSGGGTPSFYVELYKYSGTTFTLIASNSSSPELIAFGATINPYFSALAVPETVLLATDRLAIRIYVTHSGRTITLHTENSHLCQIITTFTTGLQSLNGLTKQTQYFAVGTSGTDFNISSSVDTHTFNIPSASASNRGLITTETQTIAGAKTFNTSATFTTNTTNAITASTTSGTAVVGTSTNYIGLQGSSTSGKGLVTTSSTGVGAEINSGSGVALTALSQSNDIALFYGASSALKASISQAGNITANSFVKSGGTSSQFLKADGSVDSTAYGTGSVTSVAAITLGTSGFDLSSSVANGTTTPVITLNVPTASSISRGVLSSTDWNTFNGKQNAITLTTTGSSGVATLVGSTLNIPNYGSALSGYVTLDTTQTITGTKTFDSALILGSASQLRIAQSASFSIPSLGFTAIDANTTNISIAIATTGSNYKYFEFNSIGLTDNTLRTYTLPNATGTLALTSNLSAYLPLTGGTLTGNLGVGYAPNLWASSIRAVELEIASLWNFAGVPNSYLSNNLFYNSSNQRIYKNNGGASEYAQVGGVHSWHTAALGVIGSVVTLTQAMTLGSNGNLLLGTTTDAGFRLDVNGTARVTGQLTLGSTITNGTYTYTLPSATGTLALTSNITSAISGTTNYVPKFTSANVIGNSLIFDSGTNVGIGTTSPSGKLEVSGGYAQFNGGGIDGNLGEAILFGNTSFPNVQKNRIRSSISASTNGNILAFEAGTATTGVYNNNQLVLKGDGNVGIGTTSPSAKLDVNETSAGVITNSITLTNASNTINTEAGLFFAPTVATGNIRGARITGFQEDGNNAIGLKFYTGVGATISEKMRITSGGNVGIGTTSPSGILHVNAGASFDTNIRVQSGAAGNHAKLTFSNSSNTVFWTAGYRSGTGDFGINYGDSFNSTGLTINTTGNVGIGTASPEAKLRVSGLFNGTQATFSAVDGRGLEIATVLVAGTNDAGSILNARGAGSGTLIFQTDGSEKMRITSTGNVGIGTTGPSTRFDVSTNLNSFQIVRFENTNNTSGNGVLVTALGSNCNNTSSYHLIAGTGGADKFYLYGNGTYTTVSDRRLKKNISTIQDTFLDKVLKLNIVNYQWNDQTDNDALELGMIAQDVEEIIPSIVHEGRPDDNGDIYKGIQASVLPYILIKAIQEQQAQIEELKALINK